MHPQSPSRGAASELWRSGRSGGDFRTLRFQILGVEVLGKRVVVIR